MLNEFTFTAVQNIKKFIAELKAHSTFGDLFLQVIAKDTVLDVKFSRNLDASEVTLLNEFVSSFVEYDATDLKSSEVDVYTIRGFELYRKIVADIQVNGGLPADTADGPLDNSILPKYVKLSTVRDLLKDGLFEYAIRYFAVEVEATNPFPAVQSTRYLDWIQELAWEKAQYQGVGEGYEYTDQENFAATIYALRNVPKGVI